MQIYEINRTKGGNRYCGPAAISAVVGCTTDEAARAIRSVSGKPSVRGTSVMNLELAYKLFGVEMNRLEHWPLSRDRPTMAAWLKDSGPERRAGRVFLLQAGEHWQIISGRRFVCGRSVKVVPLDDQHVKRRARVLAVFELLAPNGIVKSPPQSRPTPVPELFSTFASS
jgi:hypothetical protein